MEKFQTFQVGDIRSCPRHGRGKGPWRICKFCLLGVLLPVIFLFIPLYMRFRALRPISLTLSPSDMKLLNHETKVSSSWCEAQNIYMNSTFHAYLLPDRPRLMRNRQRITMQRDMVLEDDVKEYWGFYLLGGSYFKVRACSRHEGASLVVIKSGAGVGQCAWLGELDSAEEIDEVSQEFEFQTNDVMEESDDIEVVVDNTKDIDMDMKNDTSMVAADSREIMKYPENIGRWNTKSQNIIIQELLGLQAKNPMEKESTKIVETLKKFRAFEIQIDKIETETDKKFKEFKIQKEREEARTLIKLRALQKQNEKEKAETAKKIRALKVKKEKEKIETDVLLFELKNAASEGDNENVGSEIFDGKDEVDGEIEHFLKSGKLNQKDAKDKSNEEVRSSWSSSEEALVACEGVIHLVQLDGATKCNQNASHQDLNNSMIEITHMVEKTGFYYFIFSNENEITDNFISSSFEMHKTVFDVSKSTVKCLNSSHCSLPLTFRSEEHVVLEVPQTANSSCEYDTEVLTSYHQCNNIVRAESVCQPRGKLYMVFLLLVPIPILILIFSYI